MASRVRRKLPRKRRAASSSRRLTSKRPAKSHGRTTGRRRQATRRRSRGANKWRAAEEQATLSRLFDEQIDPLWSRFGTECRQFVDGFNAEWGSPKLQIETGADVVMARLVGGGELLLQLVRENRHAFCVVTSGCTDLGACRVDQLPIGFSINDSRLRLMYGATEMTEDSLAVRLLTDLVAMDTPMINAEKA